MIVILFAIAVPAVIAIGIRMGRPMWGIAVELFWLLMVNWATLRQLNHLAELEKAHTEPTPTMARLFDVTTALPIAGTIPLLVFANVP